MSKRKIQATKRLLVVLKEQKDSMDKSRQNLSRLMTKLKKSVDEKIE